MLRMCIKRLDRFYNIIHTKLRHNCILNCDFFRYNIIESPSCTCGKVEDTYHYFFSCTKYARARDELFNNVFKIRNLNIVNTMCCSGAMLQLVIVLMKLCSLWFTFSSKNLNVFRNVLHFIYLYLFYSAIRNFSNVCDIYCICFKYVTFYYAL